MILDKWFVQTICRSPESAAKLTFDNMSVLNSVVEWLGFKDCNFTSIAHENHDGYHRDEKFRNPFVGSNCRYPY